LLGVHADAVPAARDQDSAGFAAAGKGDRGDREVGLAGGRSGVFRQDTRPDHTYGDVYRQWRVHSCDGVEVPADSSEPVGRSALDGATGGVPEAFMTRRSLLATPAVALAAGKTSEFEVNTMGNK